MTTNISLLTKNVLKINCLILFFMASMLFPIAVLHIILFLSQGEFVFIWDMDTGVRLITFLLSLICNVAIWGFSYEYLNIEFKQSELSFISANIINMNGQVVEHLFSGFNNIGSHNIIWNASDYPSGIYFIQLTNQSWSLSQKLMLIK